MDALKWELSHVLMEAEKFHNLLSASCEPGKLVSVQRPENQRVARISSGVQSSKNQKL